MAEYQIPTSNSTGRSSTFGQGFLRSLINRFPYSNNQSIVDNIDALNPAYKHFYRTGTDRDEKVRNRAVSIQSTGQDVASIVQTLSERGYTDILYAAVDRDKGKRIREYRIMAAFSEMANALDEICDEAIVEDDKGEVAKLTLPDAMDGQIRKELINEFNKVINYFDLKHKGWEYTRSILVDAEVYFENVISETKPELGILGVVSLPTELVNPIYDNVQNLIIKGFLLKKLIIDPKTQKIISEQLIPLDLKQVTYLNSGIWNEDKSIKLPFIENARRAYKQLSLIEDSIIIYRLVRAPERLVFRVDVGNMPTDKAEQYLQQLMQKYWSKKTFDAEGGKAINIYDPQSMLDSYWFAKRPGSEGTTVETLPGGQNLGQLDDLLYFQKKLYKSLKVPANRLNPDTPFADGAEITREELKFARFVIRIQSHIAVGIRKTFITHLKLRKLWEEYDLKESDIIVKLNEPSSFNALRGQQIFEMKANNYNSMAENPLISNTYAQKKYLGYTDEEIVANREWLRKDAAFKWELAQIEEAGVNWKETLASNMASGAELGGGKSGGKELPPSFGPGPKNTPTTNPNEAPPPGAGPEAPAGNKASAPAGNETNPSPVEPTSNQKSKLP